MDKQKQIEEMVLAVYPWLKEVPIEERKQLREHVRGLMIMERLYNAGYRKIPEGAVVLTREELEDMKFTQEHCNLYEENKWLKAELKRQIEMVDKARKETAEKFADMGKNHRSIKVLSQIDGLEAVYRYICEGLDEIAKEIIE